MEGGAAPASVPNTMLSNFILSALLSKFAIVIGSMIVTCSPFLTGAFMTAAQVSPDLVWRRRYV